MSYQLVSNPSEVSVNAPVAIVTTMTAANMSNGSCIATTNFALDSGANMALNPVLSPYNVAGRCFQVQVINGIGSTVTISSGSGCTISGTATINASAAVVLTFIASGSSVWVVYSVGAAASSFSPGNISNSLIPIANNTYDIGSNSLSWQRVYAEYLRLNSFSSAGIVRNDSSGEFSSSQDCLPPGGDTVGLLGDNTHQWASCAVFGNVTARNIIAGVPVSTQTGTTYTLQTSDINTLIQFTNASPITVTVPGTMWSFGTTFGCWQGGAGKVTFVGSGGVTFSSLGNFTSISAQNGLATLTLVNGGQFLLAGALSA